jgi:hypothetical protein
MASYSPLLVLIHKEPLGLFGVVKIHPRHVTAREGSIKGCLIPAKPGLEFAIPKGKNI